VQKKSGKKSTPVSSPTASDKKKASQKETATSEVQGPKNSLLVAALSEARQNKFSEKSNGASGELLTDQGYGLEIEYSRKMHSKFTLRAGGAFQQFKFQKIPSRTGPENVDVWMAHLDLDFFPEKKIFASAVLGYGQDYFLNLPSQTLVVLEEYQSPLWGIKLYWNIFDKPRVFSNLRLHYISRLIDQETAGDQRQFQFTSNTQMGAMWKIMHRVGKKHSAGIHLFYMKDEKENQFYDESITAMGFHFLVNFVY